MPGRLRSVGNQPEPKLIVSMQTRNVATSSSAALEVVAPRVELGRGGALDGAERRLVDP